jgi:hypothetical protein
LAILFGGPVTYFSICVEVFGGKSALDFVSLSHGRNLIIALEEARVNLSRSTELVYSRDYCRIGESIRPRSP